jgi:hypothetical protein
MKLYVLPLFILSLSCSSNNDLKESSSTGLFGTDLLNQTITPVCPQGHSDSIIPIVYGYPSEELFAQSDSGLVALGGCELDDFTHYCKIHKTSFIWPE